MTSTETIFVAGEPLTATTTATSLAAGQSSTPSHLLTFPSYYDDPSSSTSSRLPCSLQNTSSTAQFDNSFINPMTSLSHFTLGYNPSINNVHIMNNNNTNAACNNNNNTEWITHGTLTNTSSSTLQTNNPMVPSSSSSSILGVINDCTSTNYSHTMIPTTITSLPSSTTTTTTVSVPISVSESHSFLKEKKNHITRKDGHFDKKEAQKLRNRLSAQLHRDRQKMLLTTMKTQLQCLGEEKLVLERKIQSLLKEITSLQLENNQLKSTVEHLNQQVPKTLLKASILDTDSNITKTTTLLHQPSQDTFMMTRQRILSSSFDDDNNTSLHLEKEKKNEKTTLVSPFISKKISSNNLFLNSSTINENAYNTIIPHEEEEEEEKDTLNVLQTPLTSTSLVKDLEIENPLCLLTSENLLISHNNNNNNNNISLHERSNTLWDFNIFPYYGNCNKSEYPINNNNNEMYTHCYNDDCMQIEPNHITTPSTASYCDSVTSHSSTSDNHNEEEEEEDHDGSSGSTSASFSSLSPICCNNIPSSPVMQVTSSVSSLLLKNNDDSWENHSKPLKKRLKKKKKGGVFFGSSPLLSTMSLFITLVTLFYVSPENHYHLQSDHDNNHKWYLPAPSGVNAIASPKELIVYSHERSLVPVDYFKKYAGPKVLLRFVDKREENHYDHPTSNSISHAPYNTLDTTIHKKKNLHHHVVETTTTTTKLKHNNIKLNDLSLISITDKLQASFHFLNLLCPNPKFLVGTKKDLDAYLNSRNNNKEEKSSTVSTSSNNINDEEQFKTSITMESIDEYYQNDNNNNNNNSFQHDQIDRDITNEKNHNTFPSFILTIPTSALQNVEFPQIMNQSKYTDDTLLWETNSIQRAKHAVDVIKNKSQRLINTFPTTLNDDSISEVLEDLPLHIICNSMNWDGSSRIDSASASVVLLPATKQGNF